MERRKFVIGLGALSAGGAAAMSTGAFTSVEADRDVTVDVVESGDALLGIEETDDSANADYVTVDDDSGVIGIDITDSNDDIEGGGEGFNEDATTIVRSLFDVTNQGTQPVLVFVREDPPIGIFADNFDQDRPDTGLAVGGQPENAPLGKSKAEKHYLKPGETLSDIGIFGSPDDDIDGNIELVAATPEELYFSNLGAYEDIEDFDSPEEDDDFDPDELEDNADWRD